MIKQYIAQNEDIGRRLDQVLLNILPSITRTTAKKLLMEGIVRVNDEQLRPNYKVKQGDHISYNEKIIKDFLESESHSFIKPIKMNINVIYEDEYTLIVDKPYGLTTHPVPGHREDTLLNGLVYYQENISKLKSGKVRPVHRLDKDTSGVILFAKTKEAHDYYSKQFEENKVEKTYYAIVRGDFKKFLGNREYITVQNYLNRSTKDRKKVVVVSKEIGQVAITNIFFERHWDKFYSLVKVQPKTGRTHQIRVHLAHIGFPILGDIFYSPYKFKRLMLHAYSLKIRNFLDKEEVIFSSKLPQIFK